MSGLANIDLVLASTSRYRRELLARLTPSFRTLSPLVDESPLVGEPPHDLAIRLAASKAGAIAADCPNALIIGSDQVADLDGRMLGKSGAAAAAREQLDACSGQSVIFHTAVCLIDTRVSPARTYNAIDTTHVFFRALAADEIERYIDMERPFDCAGSFKVEGLGITLFERVQTDDPTALVGLPLIALARLLRAAGVAVP